jgi:hypothetical protein
MRIVSALIVGVLILADPRLATAAQSGIQRELFLAPKDLWIMHSDGSSKLYGPSSNSAAWSVGQWNIPRELPPFEDRVTQNEFARVMIERDGTISLSQFADALTCNKTYTRGIRDVHEFDLLLRPNNAATPGYPQATTNAPARLSALSHIYHTIDVEPISVEIVDRSCSVTKTTFLTAIVLSNSLSRQTLFYQVRLGVVDLTRASRLSALERPFWFAKGTDLRSGHSGYYGYDDTITSYGQEPVMLRTWSKYALDVLPRLTELLREGADVGLDQNLADWTISGTYYGQIAWGHLRATSQWRSFSFIVE